MTTLYSCKSEIDLDGNTSFRITKFDSDLNVESSYLTTSDHCACPAGERPSCRHRQMLPKFLARGAVNTGWMLDFDRNGWVDMRGLEPSEAEVGLSGTEAEHSVEHDVGVEHEQSGSYTVSEQDCPGHAASYDDKKVCRYCGVHIDSLRPELEPQLTGLQEEQILMGFHQPELAQAYSTILGENVTAAHEGVPIIERESLGDALRAANIPGVTVVDLSDPRTLFNTIADAVGEPRLETDNRMRSQFKVEGSVTDRLPPHLNRRGF